MTKILFMDIDGVLINEWSLTQKSILIDEITDYQPYAPECVKALNMLITHFNADVVIHSTRRYQYSLEEFKEIWRKSGIQFNNLSILRYGDMEEKWFNNPNEEKAYDLKKYIAKHSISQDSYLVIEDMKLKIKNLFLVDSTPGLTIADAKNIIQL